MGRPILPAVLVALTLTDTLLNAYLSRHTIYNPDEIAYANWERLNREHDESLDLTNCPLRLPPGRGAAPAAAAVPGPEPHGRWRSSVSAFWFCPSGPLRRERDSRTSASGDKERVVAAGRRVLAADAAGPSAAAGPRSG